MNKKEFTNEKNLIFFSIVLVCIFLINVPVIFAQTAQANNAIPYGTWEVSQIVMEKNTNGKVETKVYNKAAEMKERIPCPQAWEIKDSGIIVLRYSDNVEETTEYTIEDSVLTINSVGIVLKYMYTLNNETLTLTVTQKYMWNQPDGLVDDIEEKRTITLKMQN